MLLLMLFLLSLLLYPLLLLTFHSTNRLYAKPVLFFNAPCLGYACLACLAWLPHPRFVCWYNCRQVSYYIHPLLLRKMYLCLILGFFFSFLFLIVCVFISQRELFVCEHKVSYSLCIFVGECCILLMLLQLLKNC